MLEGESLFVYISTVHVKFAAFVFKMLYLFK